MLFIQVQVQFQKLHELFTGGGVGGETVGVLEDATANHEAVNLGVLCVKGEGVSFIFNVTVDDKLGVGAEGVTEFDDGRDELVVGRDLAHFFFGAEMDGEGGRVFS